MPYITIRANENNKVSKMGKVAKSVMFKLS